jgi:hypothetical protein
MSITNLYKENTNIQIQKQNQGKYCPLIIKRGKKKVYFNYVSNIISIGPKTFRNSKNIINVTNLNGGR